MAKPANFKDLVALLMALYGEFGEEKMATAITLAKPSTGVSLAVLAVSKEAALRTEAGLREARVESAMKVLGVTRSHAEIWVRSAYHDNGHGQPV